MKQDFVTFAWNTYADSLNAATYTVTGLVSGSSHTFAV
jgi:hypothetical protein